MGLLDRFAKKPVSEPAAPVTDSAEPESVTSPGATEPEGRPHLLGRLRHGLRRTSQLLNTDIRDLFKQDGQLVDDDILDQLYALLVRTDMGSGPAREIRQAIQDEYRGRVVTMNDILQTVRERLLELMAQDLSPLNLQTNGPTVIVVVGVNGSGKTTSIAKLARLLIDQDRRVVLGAGDTFRAAAVEQLTVWAQRLGVEIVTGPPGSDPASVAHRAVARMLETNADVAIIDTAGRLQTQSHLMDQLTKIRRVIEKLVSTAPHEVLLVLDATAGQNGISQAKGFSDAVQCTGIVLSKLDGTAKGGVIIPIRQQFQIPVKYVGVGERPTDLAPFDPESFVTALFASRG
jgi:fused signal recognition particle receptor